LNVAASNISLSVWQRETLGRQAWSKDGEAPVAIPRKKERRGEKKQRESKKRSPGYQVVHSV